MAIVQSTQPELIAAHFVAGTKIEYPYDYATHVLNLGSEFVDAAWYVVLKLRDNLRQITWRNKYVFMLERLFLALGSYVQLNPTRNRPVSAFSPADWRLFQIWAESRISESEVAAVTAKTHVGLLRRLLARLIVAKVIPPIPESKSPYFLAANPKRTYEYSRFVSTFGAEFIGGACEAIRAMRKHVKAASWMDHYVIPLDQLFSALDAFLAANPAHPRPIQRFSATQWECFCAWHQNRLVNRTIVAASSTRATLLSKTGKLLNLLVSAGITPVPSITDSKYFLVKNKFVTYEYSGYAKTLGPVFVERACQVVREMRRDLNINEETWRKYYVVGLRRLFDALQAFLAARAGSSTYDVEDFTSSDWNAFCTSLMEHITSASNGRTGIVGIIASTNKLLVHLAAARVIPQKIELVQDVPRQAARPGHSARSVKGWKHKPKAPIALSPFGFHVEQHNRSYDYKEFCNLGHSFLLSVVGVLKPFLAQRRLQSVRQPHSSFLRFLRHLCILKSQGAFPDFYKALDTPHFAAISVLQWEHVVYNWRESLIEGEPSKSGRAPQTIHGVVTAFRLIWRQLSGAGFVPPITIVGIKNAKKRGTSKPRRTLAQLFAKERRGGELEDAAWSQVSRFFDPMEQSSAHGLIRALCTQLTPDVVRNLSIEDLVEEMFRLNATRLRELREYAETVFLSWHQHWEHGQAALQAATHSGDDLIDLLDSPLRSVSERRGNCSRLLLNGDGQIRLGNALRYVLAAQDGIASGLGGRYPKLIASFNLGFFDFHAYLHPHHEATVAIWVLLLVDTGANCEVVREMPWDCLVPAREAGYMTLQLAPKLRAGGKTIVYEVPVAPSLGQRISAVQAIQRHQEMAKRYRVLAEDDSKDKLLLHERNGHVHPVSAQTAEKWFVRFLRRCPGLSALEPRPSMIRPSVLLDVQHRNPDGLIAAQALADHESASTTLAHYTGRLPTTLTYNLRIREFQNRLQAVIIVSIAGAPGKLGLTDDEFVRILSDAARTGLGVACLNPLAGIQPGTQKGLNCTRLDRCCSCEMRWIVATPDNIADMVLFNEQLHSSQLALAHQNLNAWEDRWLPWLVFSDIVLKKLSQGETASVFAEANVLVSQRRAQFTPRPLS